MYLKLCANFLISVCGGLASNHFFDLTNVESFFTGLSLFILIELIILLSEFEKIKILKKSLTVLVDTIYLSDNFSNYYLSLVFSNVRGITNNLINNGIEISKEDTPKIWTECIAHVNDELVGTSYIVPKDWWDKSYADPNVELRKYKARSGKNLRTLFLWNDKEELNDLKKIAEDQRKAGINVSHAHLSSLLKDKVRKAKLKIIGTPDFAIIDSHWVFLHFLDNNRETKKGITTHNKKIVGACKDFLTATPGTHDFSNPREEA